MLQRDPRGRGRRVGRSGKNVFAYKLQSLTLGAGAPAVAGLFFAFQFSFFSPGDFEPLLTFFAWTIVILGGTARNWARPGRRRSSSA